jgi:hypothetical protein
LVIGDADAFGATECGPVPGKCRQSERDQQNGFHGLVER